MARKRRGGVRTGSKRVTERILENVRFLKEHPEHAVPRCQGSCPLFCYFKRARKAVERRHGMIGDDDKLKRWSNWGNKLGRAYAAALRLAEREKDELEYFQNVNTHKGTVPIAPWGKSPVLAQVGLQHRHEPSLRLLSAVPFVGSGDAVYATDEGLVCAHEGGPPEDAIEHLLEELPVEKASPTLARCPHVPDEWTDATYVELRWRDAGLRIRVCDACTEDNLLARVQNVVVTKSIRDLVDIRVQLPRLVDPEGGQSPEVQWSIPETVLEAYAGGEIPDAELIEEAERARRFAVEGLGEPMVVKGTELYRPPFGQLLDKLDVNETERALLEAALAELTRPVVLDRGTAIELLAELWPEHGDTALEAVLGASGLELYEPGADAEDLERLVDDVADRRARQQVDAALPSYDEVPAPVDLADRVARAYLRRGRQRAQQILNDTPDEEHRAIALALVRALDLPSTAWTVHPRTEETAEHLVPYAEQLLEARGDAYHEALQKLLRATGSTKTIERSG